MCYNVLKEMAHEKEERRPMKAAVLPFRNDTMFKALMQEIETQRAQGFPPHPKLDCLLDIALEHFLPPHPENKSMEANCGEVKQTQTRMMVFVTFRDCVEEVVQALNTHHLTIRASRFVGQAKDKEGKKGIDQAGQSEVSGSESSFYHI